MKSKKPPMTEREARRKLAALPPEAQKKHKNFMALMEAAQRRDKPGMEQLLHRFRTEKDHTRSTS